MRIDREIIEVLNIQRRILINKRKEMQGYYENNLNNSILAPAYKDLYNYYDGRLEELESVLKILGINISNFWED